LAADRAAVYFIIQQTVYFPLNKAGVNFQKCGRVKNVIRLSGRTFPRTKIPFVKHDAELRL
jgi:hypothetical protein